LETIQKKKTVHRIRLSSIEPNEIDDRLLALAAPRGILCDHFHIPLQSGDDVILQKMKRPYTAGFFSDTILRIHEKLPFAGIGVDVLAGFPMETDQQFENTFELIRHLPVSYLHVFPFSPRQGTPAFHYFPKVDDAVIKERCSRLRELGAQKRAAFIQANTGRCLEGVVQHTEDAHTGRLIAVTTNYLHVLLEKNDHLKGKIVDLVCEQCDSNLRIFGKIHNPLS
jgi:threonylcarbamoyladenosine tRNA methylthiotransferase MtaB